MKTIKFKHTAKLAILIAVLFIFNSCNTTNRTALRIAEETGAKIVIANFGFTYPNSVGGVNTIIHWTNTTGKTIKYITFYVIAYNAVGDVVRCSIRRESPTVLKITGPIEHGWGRLGGQYSNVWYNRNISTLRITKIDIEFMDGTNTTLSYSDFHIMRGPRQGTFFIS